MNDVWGWRQGHGLRPADAGPARLLVADSWLLEHGRMRGLEPHRRRFAAGCADAGGPEPSEVDDFWQAAVARLPRAGTWFPRVELVAAPGGAQLRLRVRPAPARTEQVVVWVHGEGDPRAVPRRKGPDLDRLGELRHRAVEAGANEALLTTGSGYVLEAATSSVLWWEGDQLCLPDPSWRVLPSVTVALIRQAAAERGITVRSSRRRLSELAGREVWLANALHGIRPVTAWAGSDVPAGPAVRAPSWRRWWQEAAVALPKRPNGEREISRMSEIGAP
ncbi:aminotransferase class IV [Amycolatopsis nigrescens]|uniref:aminotransferase class IV n=1 Tax=Amycolatopsis nigrescens TaxID=381445 RepID=UPI000399C61B|nr:aminotransferase class IV [Amycolatopsis nigrescens]